MKKILFVHHVSEVGGASYCLLSIIKELNRNKFEPMVLLRNYGSLVDELKKLHVDIIYCPSLWCYPYNKTLFNIRNLVSILGIYRSFPKFEKLLVKCNPDIIYFNNTFLFPYLNISFKKGIKSVIHIREHWPMKEHVNQLQFIRKQILRKANSIIAINKYSAQMISNDSPKIKIVYDWIDLETRYEPMPLCKILGEDTSSLKIFIFTGGMQPAKGTYEVLKTFSTKITDCNSRLLVLGFSKEISEEGVKGNIKRLLRILGYYTYEYKVKAIAQNDSRIICIPSTYNIKDLLNQSYCMLSYFTIPHANLAMAEAMTEELPCIAAKTEESLEYTENGKYALLFDMNDIASFEKCFDNLEILYTDIKNKLQSNASHIKEMFSKEENSKRLMTILASL